jgi:outer membrane lipoprotein-sorting protein
MKKTITLIVVIALVSALMLTGCASVNKKEDASAAPSASASAIQSETKESPEASKSQQAESSTSAQAGGDITNLLNAAKNIANISFDFSVSSGGSVLASGSMWSETGKMLKIKTTVSGIDVFEIIDIGSKTMTTYMPQMKTGQKMAAPAGIDSTDPGSYLSGVDLSKLKDDGTDTVNGDACRVVEYSDESGNTVKMWISTKFNFPVKINAMADGKEIEMDYTNISTEALPAGTFDIPSDITFTPAS